MNELLKLCEDTNQNIPANKIIGATYKSEDVVTKGKLSNLVTL